MHAMAKKKKKKKKEAANHLYPIALSSSRSLSKHSERHPDCSSQVRSIYLASKVLIAEMKKNGPGSTVVISSENAILPGATQTWYNAIKSMALEHARDQLRFNTICPTSGNTLLLKKFAGIGDGPVPDDIIKAKCEAIPIGRLVEPADVANVALFLAEPASSIISGVEILVDGVRCV